METRFSKFVVFSSTFNVGGDRPRASTIPYRRAHQRSYLAATAVLLPFQGCTSRSAILVGSWTHSSLMFDRLPQTRSSVSGSWTLWPLTQQQQHTGYLALAYLHSSYTPWQEVDCSRQVEARQPPACRMSISTLVPLPLSSDPLTPEYRCCLLLHLLAATKLSLHRSYVCPIMSTCNKQIHTTPQWASGKQHKRFRGLWLWTPGHGTAFTEGADGR
ncbi:hypothetical protein B0T22DRAFT_446221 [Podospora appendiculata]|uniref:Uncharacterized protein n=1 Tax=Podospora appendiculata TaxID=314037 RepID=A0AAE0XEX3_9PEZI|nr:hypothetical protein B0T22DRAFT_446221 [Podospora appendiculata]